jgi:hypothetical protein
MGKTIFKYVYFGKKSFLQNQQANFNLGLNHPEITDPVRIRVRIGHPHPHF